MDRVLEQVSGADLGGGCRGCVCKKNYVVYWCCSRARDECTPPKKNPGSASGCALFLYSPVALLSFKRLDSIRSSLITQRHGRTEVTQDITNYVYIE